jgi:hypothetical protein
MKKPSIAGRLGSQERSVAARLRRRFDEPLLSRPAIEGLFVR